MLGRTSSCTAILSLRSRTGDPHESPEDTRLSKNIWYVADTYSCLLCGCLHGLQIESLAPEAVEEGIDGRVARSLRTLDRFLIQDRLATQELNVSHSQTEDMLDLNVRIGEEPAAVGRLQSGLRDKRIGRGAGLVASISSDTLHDLVEWYSSNAWEQVKDETSTRVDVSLSARDSTMKGRARVPKGLTHHVIYTLQAASYDLQKQR